jgi:TonB family protein
MEEAQRHLVSRVEPTTPAAAAAAQIGGTVVAEIIITVKGTVESVRILAGAPELHAAASAAVGKWTFRPFLRNGKPARVTALVDLKFPDPKTDEMLRQSRELRMAEDQCGQEIRERSARAVAVCADALRQAEVVHRQDLSQRFRIRQQYAIALVQAGRPSEALPELERALVEWTTRAGENDADAADNIAMIALVHQRLGNHAKADESFERAARAFQGAIDRSRSPSDYFERFASVLTRHAALKRATGQEDAAKALETRAAEVTKATPPVRTESVRVVAGVPCLCPDPPHFDEADVVARLKAIPAAVKPWLVESDGGMASGKPLAIVYEPATASAAGFRMGPVGTVTWGSAVPPGVKDRWVYGGFNQLWLQLIDSDNPADNVRSRRDTAWPIAVMWTMKQPELPPAETAALARFVRSEGARTAAAKRAVPNLTKEIQPWQIESIHASGPAVFVVGLVDAATRHGQRVRIRRTANGWTIESIDAY